MKKKTSFPDTHDKNKHIDSDVMNSLRPSYNLFLSKLTDCDRHQQMLKHWKNLIECPDFNTSADTSTQLKMLYSE